MNKLIGLTLGLVLVSLTGCNIVHQMPFNAPAVPSLPMAGAPKATMAIDKVTDTRTTKTPIFIFNNPPHHWHFTATNSSAEQMVRNLVVEGFKRRGIVEATGAEKDMTVGVEVLDFSGENIQGFWYVGNCVQRITCKLVVTTKTGDKSFVVAGTAKNAMGVVKVENEVVILEKTYSDFLANLDRELEKAGL